MFYNISRKCYDNACLRTHMSSLIRLSFFVTCKYRSFTCVLKIYIYKELIMFLTNLTNTHSITRIGSCTEYKKIYQLHFSMHSHAATNGHPP